MLTDVEIAQQAKPKHIRDVAAELGLTEDDLIFYGKDKAKVSLDVAQKRADRPDGKLVLVTAITPTPAGEGKTTTTVGLGDAIRKMGHSTCIAIREPSLGPCFGVKGGAAGGGYAQVIPMADINLHFTGDFHAITTAHNLAGRDARQPHPSGQPAEYRYSFHHLEAGNGYERARPARHRDRPRRQGQRRSQAVRLRYHHRIGDYGPALPCDRTRGPRAKACKRGSGP